MAVAQEKALTEGRDHPLLERVRQCSATPGLAVNFFKKILSPCPQCRLGAEALFHGYLRPHTYQMLSELNRHRERPPSANLASLRAVPLCMLTGKPSVPHNVCHWRREQHSQAAMFICQSVRHITPMSDSVVYVAR